MVQFKKGGNTMYVIFNQDGSIKETQLGKYVNQHSKGVDFVDVAIDGRTNEDYACDANFALPNDANVTETAQINNKIVTSSGTYGGYRIGFNEAETEYDGDLSCSIRVYNKDGSVLWTFPFSIVVNKTTGYGDENITNDQYESLVRSMANYQLMFSKTNVRSYETLEEANEDLASMAEGQLVFIKNSDARCVYAKKGDSFEACEYLRGTKPVGERVAVGTWELGSENYALSKTPTSFPFIAKLSDSASNSIIEVYFCNGLASGGQQAYVGFWNDAQRMFAFFYYPSDSSQNAVKSHPFMTEPWKDGCVLASKTSEDNKTEWQSLKTVGGQSLLGTGDIKTSGDIEEITANLTGEDTATLEKAITKLPTIVNLSLDGTSILYSIVLTSKLNISSDASYYFGGIIGTSAEVGNETDLRLFVNGLSVIFHNYLPLPMPSENNVFPVWAEQGGVSWKTYASIQKKTFLHSLTAKGATLSMSFTYPSTNQLPVDSPQDAAAVIKPTANEYFASPVVVVATKKISDGYNCIHYDGTSWKFALWDGSTFTDGEAVTTWADSVVAVD